MASEVEAVTTRVQSPDAPPTDTEPRFVAPDLIQIGAKGVPRLMGGKCASCGALSFPKRKVCGECLAMEIVDAPLSSEGVLYSYSLVHQAPKGWDLPYVLGYVDLPEGIRILSHIEGALDQLRVDGNVQLGVGRVGTDPVGNVLMSFIFKPGEGVPK